MANEIHVTLPIAYPSLYAMLWDANDAKKAWDGSAFTVPPSGDVWEPWAAVNLTMVGVTPDSNYIYSGDIPVTVPQRLLNVSIRDRTVNGVGNESHENDQNVASGVIAWGGSSVGVIFPATFTQVQEALSELSIIQTSLAELYDLVSERCGEQTDSGESGGGSSSDSCVDSAVPYDTFLSLISQAQSITVDGMTVQERSLKDLIEVDKYLRQRSQACGTNRGNGWNMLSRSRGIPPDSGGRW